MTVHYRWSCQILYERYTEFMENQRQKAEVAKARGWVTSSFWQAISGTLGDFFLVREYESLTDLAAELAARESDFEFMRLMRASYPMVVQGSIRIEIFESVDPSSITKAGSLRRSVGLGPQPGLTWDAEPRSRREFRISVN